MTGPAIAAVTEDETPEPEKRPDLPDEIELLDSGRIRFRIDGRTITLRTPKLGEIREYRLRLAELRTQEIDRDKDPDGDQPLIDLMRWVCERYGDGRLPTPDENLPGWIVNATLPMTLLKHWRSLPLASGDQ